MSETLPVSTAITENKQVTIKKIENGYLVEKTWSEKKGDKCDFNREETFIESLPNDLSKFFDGDLNKEKEIKNFDEAEDESKEMFKKYDKK